MTAPLTPVAWAQQAHRALLAALALAEEASAALTATVRSAPKVPAPRSPTWAIGDVRLRWVVGEIQRHDGERWSYCAHHDRRAACEHIAALSPRDVARALQAFERWARWCRIRMIGHHRAQAHLLAQQARHVTQVRARVAAADLSEVR